MKGDKSKHLMFLLILSFLTFVYPKDIQAATTYKTNVTNGFEKNVKVTLRGDGVVNQNGWAKSNTGQYSIYYKHTGSNFAICTSFSKENRDVTYNCTREDSGWSKDEAVASGVASIILKGTGGIGSTMSMVQYFNAELAVNKYLYKTKYGKSANSINYSGANISKINSLVTVGVNAAQAYNDFKGKKKKMNIKMTALKCNRDTSTCTTKISYSGVKNSKTKYDSITVSNPKIKVNGTGQASYDESTGTVTITGVTGSITVKATSTVTRKYYVAQNYSCGNNNQPVTLNKVAEKTQTRNLSTSKSIDITSASSGSSSTHEVADCDLMLYKVNTRGEPLAGSSFFLFDNGFSTNFSDKGEAELEGDEEEIYNGKCISLNNAASVDYKESVAPTGYKLDTTKHTLNITDQIKNAGEYDIPNTPNTNLIIYKKDGDTNKKVAGAKLVLYQGDKLVKWKPTTVDGKATDANGNEYVQATEFVDLSDLDDSNIAKLKTEASWTTKATGVNFVGLEYDSYTIEELSAPANYIINDEFKVITLENVEGKRAQTVEVTDYPSSITLSKQDITNKKEISGAKLQIVDGQGNVYDEWISGTKPHVITTLKDGTYYLKETTAPKGYELNTEIIEFTVANGKAKSTVVMYNSPSKITVADTLMSKTVLTYVIGSMMIIAGIGVLYYERKKKKLS